MKNINEKEELWSVKCFGSGTHIVTSENHDLPHYYIYAKERLRTCRQLSGWLNFSERPAWANTLRKEYYNSCTGDHDIRIIAVGPMIKNENGSESDPNKEQERRTLIDALVNSKRG